ncbi:Ecdysteroid UDP-glucosyltransferase [Eumeta japonica]|uniref:Ecdysteroid UDP-glucosyltransferase n=1 Tax=Eumeta variegata TaxID=151549 RepID=A0A4C1U548_EUMVA|nr:Ecdysteroid UDP-glucosyltransferase [Eumeta japonica]
MKLFLLLSLVYASDAYRILVVFPMPGKSHSILGQGFVDTLSQAGHEVTYITAFPYEKPPANVRQVNISSVIDNVPSDILKITNLVNSPFRAHMAALMGPGMMVTLLDHENVQEFLADTTQKFDVVIVEWFYTSLLAGFASIYKAPLIWVSSMDPHWQVLEIVDEPSNPAYTASVLTKATPPFGFFDRVNELFMQLYVKFLTIIANFVLARPTYNKHFVPAFEKRGMIPPGYDEMAHNGSFMFFNAQPVLSIGQRLTQNTRYIGGYHIDPDTKPLPENLKKIFDNAKNGVIYFSMGSNLKSKDMSDYTKRGLLEMFGTLKQTVLWKFEEELRDLPHNVHIVKWAPQPSILSHPKTVLFITHGGKLSTIEAIHYGVPVIGVPIFGDQFANMDQAVLKGYGIKVDYEEDLAKPLRAALDEMLSKPSYAEIAKRISTIFHDVIASPRQELVHWVEHVVRTQGAPHLRSIALHVPWYQKIYLDLIAVTVILLNSLNEVVSAFDTPYALVDVNLCSFLRMCLGKNSNFLKLISKRCTRSELVNCANGSLLQHRNSMNIRGVSAEKDAIRHQTMETAKINQSGSFDVR